MCKDKNIQNPQDAIPANKESLWQKRKKYNRFSRVYLLLMHLFALFGFAMIAAWGLYKLGITNNAGGIDKNNRYLADYRAKYKQDDSTAMFASGLQSQIQLSLLHKVFPKNARLIYEANRNNSNPNGVDRMIYALNLYLKDDPEGQKYKKMLDEIERIEKKYAPQTSPLNAIPWMNDSGWVVLKKAILRDEKAIKKAAELTGVDARLIVACTVGEQIRLFDSKREKYKLYLGPAILSVGNQISYGVNGIKLATAERVENNLKDPHSYYYMGKKYEDILDFETEDIDNERIERLTSYKDHLYSFIYTGCILHQTMLQWKRAGYDISDRPDILCTLFNLGFVASHPKAEPRCGGSRIHVGGREYTFGVIGNDFYYSGELTKQFPIPEHNFHP